MPTSICDARPARRKIGRLVIAAAALLALAPVRSVRAGFTEPIPNKEGEPEQGPILSHALGGTFTAEGNNFTNGAVTATQIDDNDDQIWTGSIISAQAVAAFSTDPEIFGYINGTGQGNFVPLFTASGNGYDVTGSSGGVPLTGSYQLARSGTSTFSSEPANNPNKGSVHLLTYAITGLPNQAPNTQTWMLFWEDTVAQYSDWDFNDLVVKLQTDPAAGSSSTPPLLIPLPPAAWSGLSGLAVLLAVAGITRLRRQLA
jgi:Domain of unknown function (DUF4114)